MKKLCRLCEHDREFTGNRSICDGCIDYMQRRRKQPMLFVWHTWMFFHKIGRQHCKKKGSFAFHHYGTKHSIYVDIINIKNHFGLNYIDYISHILSHEFYHLLLHREQNKFTSVSFDGSWIRLIMMPYLGGKEFGIGANSKRIDKMIEEFHKKIKEDHRNGRT